MLMATLRKTNQRKLRIYKGILCLAVCFLLLRVIFGADNQTGISYYTTKIFQPVMRLGASVSNAVSNGMLMIGGESALQRENEQLREELMEMKLQKSKKRSEEALASLMQEVSTNLPREAFDLIPAPLLSYPLTGDREILWIGGGEEAGFEPGMIVLSSKGIVGEIVRVFPNSAEVELVTDEKSTWGAETNKSHDLGLLKGTGSNGWVEFHLTVTAHEMEVGDLIVSSGMSGSIAPGGIPFGQIEEISVNKKGEPVARLKLLQDPREIRTFFVLPHQKISDKGMPGS